MKYSKRTIAGAVAGAVLAGGAAFAAVSLWGSGRAAVAATQSQGLIADNVKIAPSLVPGGKSSATADIFNPNDFSAKVTGIVIITDGQTATGEGCDPATVHVGTATNPGTPATAKISATGAAKAGKRFPVVVETLLAPHEKKTVTVNDVVSQDAGATAFCGFTADFGVEAETAGN